MAVKRKTPKAGEKEAKREPARTPGDILKRAFMEPLGLTAYRVAKDLGIPQITLSQILRGNRGISPAMAVRLGSYFGVEPKLWLGMQADYDLALIAASAAEKPVERCALLGDREFQILTPGEPKPAPAPKRALVIRVQGRPRR